MGVFVILRRKKEGGIYLPFFSSCDYKPDPEALDPKWKVIELLPNECVDVGRFTLHEDHISAELCRVSNLDGVLDEKITEKFLLPRFGNAQIDRPQD